MSLNRFPLREIRIPTTASKLDFGNGFVIEFKPYAIPLLDSKDAKPIILTDVDDKYKWNPDVPYKN